MIASTLPKSMGKRFRKTALQVISLVASSLLFSLASLTAQAQVDTSVTDILYSKMPGDNIQINIVADGALQEPGSFSTDSPARIALDFFGLKSKLGSPRTLVQTGKVESILAVETADRTRVIINLYDTARYKLTPTDDGYSVTVFSGELDDSNVKTPKPFASRPDIVSGTNIENIDFRRSDAGGGKLIVDFSDDGVTVDTREQDGEIVLDLIDVNLPAEFERRLDVVDFATPLQAIDTFQNADNVRMVLVPQGKYQQISYQQGNRFTLVVDPIVVSAEEERDLEDAALGYEGERLSINFQKIDVRSALAVIADFTGINFVTSDTVQGDITLNLKDVPWDQALDVILRTRGLSQRRTGDVVWVAPAEEIREFEEKELRNNAVVEEFAPLVTEVVQINYAKAADIADVIRNIQILVPGQVSSQADLTGLGVTSSAFNQNEVETNTILSARGSITVDARTNSIIVQDLPEKIENLRNVVAKLDKPVRQVLIETRIVEANDTFSKELGARLGFQRITENARFPGSNESNIGDFVSSGTTEGLRTIQDSRANDDGLLEFDSSRGVPGGLAVDLGADAIGSTNPASYAFDLFRTGTGFAHLITLELSALEADGRGRVVASPRLITANQRAATISQGQEFPDEGGNTQGGGGGGTAIEAELTLTVTPQITPDDRVILDVNIDQKTVASLSPLILNTKFINTQVLSDNGETVVIGGIYQEDSSEGVTKVPLLGDLPILGNLFKKRSKQSNRTELLIFLTPKIISPKLNLG